MLWRRASWNIAQIAVHYGNRALWIFTKPGCGISSAAETAARVSVFAKRPPGAYAGSAFCLGKLANIHPRSRRAGVFFQFLAGKLNGGIGGSAGGEHGGKTFQALIQVAFHAVIDRKGCMRGTR